MEYMRNLFTSSAVKAKEHIGEAEECHDEIRNEPEGTSDTPTRIDQLKTLRMEAMESQVVIRTLREDVACFKEELEEREFDIDVLQEELRLSSIEREEIPILRLKLSENEERLEQISRESRQRNDRIRELISTNEILEKRISTVEQEWESDAMSLILEWREERDELSMTQRLLNEELKKSKLKHERVEGELKRCNNELKDKVLKWSSDYNNLHKAYGINKLELDNSIAQVATLKKEVEEFQGDEDELEEELQKLKEKHEKKCNEWNRKCQLLRNECTNKQTELNRLEEELNEANEKLTENDAENKKLIEFLRSENVKVLSKFKNKCVALEKCKSRNKTLEEQLSKITQQLKENEKESVELRKYKCQNMTLEEHLSKITQQLEKNENQSVELAKCKGRNKTLEDQLKSDRFKHDQERERLNLEFEKLREECAEIKEELDNYKSSAPTVKCFEMHQLLEELNDQIDTTLEKFTEEAEYEKRAAIRKKIDRLDDEFQDKFTRLRENNVILPYFNFPVSVAKYRNTNENTDRVIKGCLKRLYEIGRDSQQFETAMLNYIVINAEETIPTLQRYIEEVEGLKESGLREQVIEEEELCEKVLKDCRDAEKLLDELPNNLKSSNTDAKEAKEFIEVTHKKRNRTRKQEIK